MSLVRLSCTAMAFRADMADLVFDTEAFFLRLPPPRACSPIFSELSRHRGRVRHDGVDLDVFVSRVAAEGPPTPKRLTTSVLPPVRPVEPAPLPWPRCGFSG